ncbi:ParB/RepB/Spo0J family partition protein [Phenylobacterium sp.]|uniref:ParB/RepB/Spo0J family partition protein n=1 Tax=Phenylobacterium sp. TaxID=1871053 RepID=UPI00391A85B4
MNPPILTPLAVQNITVLQALKAGGHESIADLARALGRDKSNLRNTLASLTEAGLAVREDLVPVPVITAAGEAALDAWARANGVREAGAADGSIVFHRQIRPDPNQPRKHFDAEALDELRESIVADELLENLVVRPDPERDATDEGLPAFMLIAGERRWRAIELAIQDGDWEADRPVGVTVREVDEATARRLALIENMQRKDLRPAEEARAIQAYMELQDAGTADVAAELKRTQRWVQQRLQLLELPQDLLWKVDDGQLKVEDARTAAALWPRLPPIKQLELREGKITVEAAKRWVDSRPAPLKLTENEELALLELAWRVAGEKNPQRWVGVRCGLRAPKGVTRDGNTLWTIIVDADGYAKASIGPGGWDHLRAITQTDAPLDRDVLAVHVLRAQRRWLGGGDPAERGLIFTGWLEKPFERDADAVERNRREAEERAAEDERLRRERAAAQAQREQTEQEWLAKREREEAEGRLLLKRLRAFEDAAAAMSPADLAAGLADLLDLAGYAGPFSLALEKPEGQNPEAVIQDAHGTAWRAAPAKLEVLRRFMVIGLNVALGLPPASGPDLDAPWSKPPETHDEDAAAEVEAAADD